MTKRMIQILERTRSEDPIRRNWYMLKLGLYGVMLAA